MAGGRKLPGYAGRKFVGKRRIDFPTPGMPNKHMVWPGLWLNLRAVEVVHGSIKPLKGA